MSAICTSEATARGFFIDGRIKKSTRTLLCVFGLSLIANPIYAQGVDDPKQIGWSSIRSYTGENFAKYFKTKSKQGYRITDIEAGPINGKPRYSAIWQRNLDKRKWRSLRDQTSEQFSKSWEDLKSNYRLIDQEKYQVGTNWRYAGVWMENKENIKWRSYRNLDDAAFKAKFKANRSAGYRMTDIDMQCSGSKMLYSAIWIKNKDNLDWAEFRNMSAATYAQKFKSFKASGHRVIDVESCHRGNKQLYAAIWVKNTNKRGWKAIRDMSAQGFANQWKRSKDQQMRLDDFEAYETKTGTRYAGVWRQNGSRLNWSKRNDADKLVNDYRKLYDIPGVSVAIGKKGEIIYARGSGFANIKKNVAAHAGTIYRLASVSKPMTAMLAMRLIDKNKLDIDKKTRSYVPSLPAHHTHTVRHLLTHRSGIRHYKSSRRPMDCKNSDPKCCYVPSSWTVKDSSSTQFARATDALSVFEDDPLRFAPGIKRCYSTHAYTGAAAALEGASGKSFPSLVASHFGKALGLPTLRAEFVKKPVKERAAIYSSATKEVKHSENSWKHAGGGLEASATDMARLGLKMFAGKVAKEKTRKIFWNGNQFSHSGGQLGAKSFWQLNFKDEIVVIVLANRKAGKPGDLARRLAALAK